MLLFIHSFSLALSSPTDNLFARAGQEVMKQSDDFIKAIDRKQPKRSEDCVGKARIECLATRTSPSQEAIASARHSRRNVRYIIPIASHLIYTQLTASSL